MNKVNLTKIKKAVKDSVAVIGNQFLTYGNETEKSYAVTLDIGAFTVDRAGYEIELFFPKSLCKKTDKGLECPQWLLDKAKAKAEELYLECKKAGKI